MLNYILIAATIIAGMFLYVRYEVFRKFISLVIKISSRVRTVLEVRKAKKEYKDITLTVLKYSVIIEAIASNLHSEEVVKSWLNKFIKDTINTLNRDGLPDDEVEKIAFAIYALVIKRKEFLEIISSFANHDDIEVKKITSVSIDVIGELYDLNNDLDRAVFKHVIVALNRTLLFLRDGGYNKKTYVKIGLTLHRLRAIMRAYNSQKTGKKLTIKQLHSRIDEVVSALNKVLTWDADSN